MILLRCCHVSWVFRVPLSLVLLSLHLKKKHFLCLDWLGLGGHLHRQSGLGFQGFLNLFSGYMAPHFWFPLGGEFLRLYPFSCSHKARCCELPVCFPQGSARKCSSLLAFSQPLRARLTFCACSPSPDWLLLSAGAHLEAGHWEEERVWVGHIEHWGCPWASSGVPSQGIPSSSWVGFMMESISLQVGRTVKLLVLSLRLFQTLASALPAFPNPSALQITSVICLRWERRGPLGQCPAQLGSRNSLIHTHLPPWEKVVGEGEGVSPGTELCGLGGGATQAKGNCASHLCQCVYSWIFFFLQWWAGMSLLDSWLPQGTLISGWLPNLKFCGGSEGRELLHRLACLSKKDS